MLAADQMEAPNIEVTISQELRDLLRAPTAVTAVAKPPSAAPVPAPTVHVTAWDMQPHTLRTDGQRPLQFSGLPVVSFAGAIGPAGLAWTVHVTVYAGQERTGYLGLSAHPPTGSGARPVHRATALGEGEADRQLMTSLSAVLAAITGPDRAGSQADLPTLTRDFNQITGNSFCTARSHQTKE